MKNTLNLFFHILLVCSFERLLADPLPSWNEGPAKNKILQFVREVTTKGNESYVSVEDRIATFDEDGTLWIEQPLYIELFFAFDRVKAMASDHPEWQDEEPFKSILSHKKDLSHFSQEDLLKIITVTHTGMSLDSFHQEVSQWIEKAIHPRFHRPFTELIYQPMIEVIRLLREHEFKVYIVSGGGQEFMRAYAENLYGIPPEQVIGFAGQVKYEYNKGNPELILLPRLLFTDNGDGKPKGINLMIGKRPIMAFGNSTGDRQMLEWTQGGKRKNFELLIYHDDAEREYAYGAESKIGTFSASLAEEAKQQDWTVVSMKNDWKVIFPWQLTHP